jgi:hypothetical protein
MDFATDLFIASDKRILMRPALAFDSKISRQAQSFNAKGESLAVFHP